MEIERINENTVKFYISYVDIEERGFDREEIWYSREKSEELFWEMMDEIHHEEEFVPEGPLWIQVQALDKGLEVLVTKAQLSKDGQRFELPIPDEKLKDLPIDERIEEFLDHHLQLNHYVRSDDDLLEFILMFNDFEDVLALSKREGLEEVETKLFAYENKYYLYAKFHDEDSDEDQIEDVLSILLEYGYESAFTVHRLEEYGKKVIDEDVFNTLNKYFA
ncbi:adapter protein MecA 1 [Siminovitchia terrae]|uniref:Adapter protein MecA n=1 Tax=Siminovitchia terrae TaxID=1914933 RepID=A0A429X8E8_SIMTE|nr:adaptor protein MecA [Siminovitchia terrae]RST59646.1 adaptor protein MecA [Siminovitchia terrae]GIN89917.1 adapter protein MecA 1 [Siminovitchia terrae]GIN97804.1 adapter protein MecA 1 [Siminovitchia terrae]